MILVLFTCCCFATVVVLIHLSCCCECLWLLFISFWVYVGFALKVGCLGFELVCRTECGCFRFVLLVVASFVIWFRLGFVGCLFCCWVLFVALICWFWLLLVCVYLGCWRYFVNWWVLMLLWCFMFVGGFVV